MIWLAICLVCGVGLLGIFFTWFIRELEAIEERKRRRETRRRTYRTLWREGDCDRVFGIDEK